MICYAFNRNEYNKTTTSIVVTVNNSRLPWEISDNCYDVKEKYNLGKKIYGRLYIHTLYHGIIVIENELY